LTVSFPTPTSLAADLFGDGAIALAFGRLPGDRLLFQDAIPLPRRARQVSRPPHRAAQDGAPQKQGRISALDTSPLQPLSYPGFSQELIASSTIIRFGNLL
jgi:hypothetical protein